MHRSRARPIIQEKPETDAGTDARQRVRWLDAARGLCILLIVFGHALRGFTGAGVIDNNGLFKVLDFSVYTFHIPLLFLLSGLFVKRQLGGDQVRFLGRLLKRLGLPYLLWSVVLLLIGSQLGSAVNHPVTLSATTFLSILWQPTSPYGFLYALLFCHLFALILVPIIGSLNFLLLTVFVRILIEFVPVPATVLDVGHFALYYAVGVYVGERAVWRLAHIHVPAAVTVSAVLAWVLLSVSALHDNPDPYAIGALPAMLAGLTACICLAMTPWLRAFQWLRRLGQDAMAIFVLHVFFLAGARILLVKAMGLQQPWLVVPIVLALGIAGPIAVASMVRPRGAREWLGLAASPAPGPGLIPVPVPAPAPAESRAPSPPPGR